MKTGGKMRLFTLGLSLVESSGKTGVSNKSSCFGQIDRNMAFLLSCEINKKPDLLQDPAFISL